jgi:arginyl-tRNA synthetase
MGDNYRIIASGGKQTVKLLYREIIKLIEEAIQNAQNAGDLPEFDIPDIKVEPSKREGQGDYAYPSMPLASLARNNPRKIGEIIASHMPEASYLEKVEVAGPGYVNFFLSDSYLNAQVETIIEEGNNLFALDMGTGKTAQVEFVSANPTGPVTIGHVRGSALGDTMARVLEAAGYDVQREYYFNNGGNQMRMLGESMRLRYLQELGHDVELSEEHYQGDYLIDYAKDLVEEQGDALVDADWKPFKAYAEERIFAWIKTSLARINIQHDNFFNEDSLFQTNAVWDTLDTLRENGYIYEAAVREGASEEEKANASDQEPAQFFRTTKFGDEKDRVLVKSDGSPTYTLPDIAYHKHKIERGFDVMVNVLGSDHLHQAKVVQWGIEALGMDSSNIHVIFNQMVNMTRGGEEVKMSTRRGEYIPMDDLVDETSPDAVRYHMLARSADSQLTFDLKKVVEQSNENPVYYIQNAYVRCCGIFREADERGVTDDGADLTLLGDDERAFLRQVMELGPTIELAVEFYEPHKIAFYAHELAGVFHPIYDRVRVLHTEVPDDVAKARLRFYRAAQVTFKRLLTLMGMSAPEHM